MKITPDDLAMWRTGLYAANPAQAQELVEMLDRAMDESVDMSVMRDDLYGRLFDLRTLALEATCGCATVRKLARVEVDR